MIYLWVDNKGWKEFEVTDTAELKKRGIHISNGAEICDGAKIGCGAKIGNGAQIGYGAEIGNGAEIGSRAQIGYGAKIGCGVKIGNGAQIGYGAKICNGAEPVIIYIIGSRFPVSYWGENRVDIGCTSRSIENWLTDYTGIAEENNFTAEEIEEYRGYVEFIKSVHQRETGKKQQGQPAGEKE
jgi:hypothetical protein